METTMRRSPEAPIDVYGLMGLANWMLAISYPKLYAEARARQAEGSTCHAPEPEEPAGMPEAPEVKRPKLHLPN
jgi:hypothetical protein